MTAIFKKLNLKDQAEIVVLNAPSSFEAELAYVEGVEIRRRLTGIKTLTFALAFVTKQKEVDTLAKGITAKAEGDAASVLQEGIARATAIESIGKAIQAHPDALKVMLVEMMPSVVQEFSKTIQNVDLGHVTVIDGGRGDAIVGAAMGRAKMLSESMALLESVLGIDLRQLSQNIAGNVAPKPDGKPEVEVVKK